MSTRIRYKDGKISPLFLAGERFVYVSLIKEDNKFHVYNQDHSLVMISDVYKNMNEVKKNAKLQLKSMGVVFFDEVRNKREQ